ncbi:retrovirus-related pol polyprotein from transposon TNT 1-94 [Tanacetum coccineum]
MDLWSGHPVNYEMLRIFSCVAYSHTNQRKLKPRAIKCIFLGYPDGVKGYKLWRLHDVKPKIIISMYVVFNESLMYKDTLKGAGAADSGKKVEFEVELQGSRVEPTVDPHTGENPRNEDEEQNEGPQQQNLDNYVLVRDRAKRITTIHARYRDKGNVSLSRPSGSKEAINSFENDEWVCAMKEEISSLKKNHTWELVDQPPGQKLISFKWLYTIKEGIEGIQKPRYKARVVARGFTQRAGIDYNEVFSPVVRHTSIRVILSLTACEHYELEQLDVKMAFLHAMGSDAAAMIVVFTSRSLHQSEIEYTKGLLRKEFDMKELGPARKILVGLCAIRSTLQGSLMYLMVCTRPDIAYAVSIVSRYLANLGKNHWEAVKWILKYLKGTADVGLVYGRDQGKHMDVDGQLYKHVVALSTTEAEYMALTEAVKESIWLKGLLIQVGSKPENITVRYHFIREIMESKEIEVAKIGTKDNAADAFTNVV